MNGRNSESMLHTLSVCSRRGRRVQWSMIWHSEDIFGSLKCRETWVVVCVPIDFFCCKQISPQWRSFFRSFIAKLWDPDDDVPNLMWNERKVAKQSHSPSCASLVTMNPKILAEQRWGCRPCLMSPSNRFGMKWWLRSFCCTLTVSCMRTWHGFVLMLYTWMCIIPKILFIVLESGYSFFRLSSTTR